MEQDLADLRSDAAGVTERLFPGSTALYAARGWTMFPSIDRVYVNGRARQYLGWRPGYDFAHVLRCLGQAPPELRGGGDANKVSGRTPTRSSRRKVRSQPSPRGGK